PLQWNDGLLIRDRWEARHRSHLNLEIISGRLVFQAWAFDRNTRQQFTTRSGLKMERQIFEAPSCFAGFEADSRSIGQCPGAQRVCVLWSRRPRHLLHQQPENGDGWDPTQPTMTLGEDLKRRPYECGLEDGHWRGDRVQIPRLEAVLFDEHEPEGCEDER